MVGGATQLHSLSTCHPDGAPVAVEEDAAAMTKLLLVCLVTKSRKVIVGSDEPDDGQLVSAAKRDLMSRSLSCSAAGTRCEPVSSSYWPVYKFFASQSQHKYKIIIFFFRRSK